MGESALGMLGGGLLGGGAGALFDEAPNGAALGLVGGGIAGLAHGAYRGAQNYNKDVLKIKS